ncbi:hypothetical protein HYW75_03275 [Candidatus Pacearchaeota archaeon]|nr:hypothetical protein [Candidatus Pacearchaeota archaeon]
MEKINATVILEILGKPKENVLNALQGLIVKLGNEQGVKIIDQVVHPIIKVKDSKELFTSFAELTLELDSLDYFFGILFTYMPSHIELISPERINLRNDELNILANKLASRLHDYDAIAKRMIAERNILIQKLQEVAPLELKKLMQPLQAQQEEKTDKQISKKKKGKKK